MNEVLRQEKKFLVTLTQMYELRKLVSALLCEDAHNRNGYYTIRSLYFDTLENKDYHEKEDGIEIRRKLRLRSYGPDMEFAMLEMKQKQGINQKKRSLRLGRTEAMSLLRGNYETLLHTNDPFAAECYSLLRMYCYVPKAVVEYRRQAFVAKENKIRITFDHHIAATESCWDIFAAGLLQYSVLDPGLAVLEVKYNGFLPSYIKDILCACDKLEISAGKYSMSRSLSLHYTF